MLHTFMHGSLPLASDSKELTSSWPFVAFALLVTVQRLASIFLATELNYAQILNIHNSQFIY